MVKKICLFGDSISKGIVIDSAQGRYTTTKRSFANLLTGSRNWLDISNYSMLGCTIEKGRSLIKRHIKDVEACDVAVLEYGGNDSDHNWAEIAADPAGHHLPKTPVDIFADDYCEIIENLRAMGKKMIMLNLPPIDEHKYFDWISRGLCKENILRWLGGSDKYIYEFHDGYNKRVCEIAARNDIPLIDIRSAFLKLDNYSDYLCDDGIHPNEKGHKLIAEVISDDIPVLVDALLFETIA